MRRYLPIIMLSVLLIVSVTTLGLVWTPPTYYQPEEPLPKGHIRVRADTVHCVRWYPDEPDWCIIHVNENEVYEISKPGQEVWDLIFEGDRTHYLTFKLR